MFNLKKEIYLKILFLLSFIVLITAYFVQYLLGYQPCNLCILERVPYALTLIILILNFKFKKDQVFFSVLLVLKYPNTTTNNHPIFYHEHKHIHKNSGLKIPNSQKII